ncbi:MAG: hypothetical protein JKY01_04185 [Pseudomonadales bacterium]|nr:hypothetical protein [Pseudomonadales bacterium]
MKKTALIFLFSLTFSLFSLQTFAGNLTFKKNIDLENKSAVFIQNGKMFRSEQELDKEKGRCRLTAQSSGAKTIKKGTSLPVTRIISQVEVQKITIKLGGAASDEFELFCQIPEFPTQENLRGIVIKNIHEEKEWAQRYNQMKAEEKAESLRVFMARAANQILDEEFGFIMSGVAKLEF